MTEFNTYYPVIEPYKIHQLEVDDIHSLHIEEYGNPDGLPIVYFHGGPGFGCVRDNSRFFDPAVYRIILFDQRGAGLSTPFAEIINNTTTHLINDIEKIRKHLKITQWILFGGSWGSTLSLAYAQTYPDCVLGLILRGVFLARPEDINWFFGGGGAKDIYPDLWKNFYEFIPHEERKDLLKAYYYRLTSKDSSLQRQAAKNWVTWQASCATLRPSPELLQYVSDFKVAFNAALLECHYYLNNCFLKPNQLLNNIAAIHTKPCVIIHGRYDMIFNVKNAWDLHQAWPGSQLCIVDDGGHAALEASITHNLINATQFMAQHFITTDMYE